MRKGKKLHSNPNHKVFTKRLHVFKAGPQTSAQGIEREFSPEDLQQVVDSYDTDTHEAPLVIGHSGDSDSFPSYGWIKKFIRKGEDLYADVDFTDTAKDLVKNGHYKKVSISFYSPDSPINPHKGSWSARHLALLGAAPPAVKGLEPFSFSEKDGVFDFVASLSPDTIFDKELGPSLILDKSPLQLLKERLGEIRGDINSSLSELEASQNNQTETDVSTNQTSPEAEITAPENPNQQFSEMKKKMGREGAEASESAQKISNLETMFPEDQYDEGFSRKKAKGAHGHEVQVVEEVYEEGEDEDDFLDNRELPEALRRNAQRMKAKAAMADMDEEEEEGEEDYTESEIESLIDEILGGTDFSEDDLDDVIELLDLLPEEDDEEDFSEEVSHKVSSKGKVKFETHKPVRKEDIAGRGLTGRSKDDGYAHRQAVGEGEPDGREDTSDDSGDQENRRKRTGSDRKQDVSRSKLAKASPEDAGDSTSRWENQPEAEDRVEDLDQFDDELEGFVRKLGISTGDEPRGRDGGPTTFPILSEEEPFDEEFAVPLKSTKGNKKVRVLHQESGDMRAALLGGEIANHSEEEADGLTKKPRKAEISDGKDARGRDGGPTEFPDLSEEDPDDLEMAVDLEDSTQSPKVRIIRQRSGDAPSTDHGEMSRDPFTRTGRGSTYGQRTPVLDEEEEFDESEDFCGMGSMGQSKAMGFPPALYNEIQSLKAENDRLRREYEEHKTRSRKAKIAEFIDNLYVEGKLTDGVIPQRELQSYCEGIEFGTLEFSEGETPTSKLFSLLSRLPNLVHYGEVVSNSPFREPDEDDMDPHQRALKMVSNGEASDYVEAIKRCIPWNSVG